MSLYADFTLTRDNCDREPIDRPLAIQGSGHLLAVDSVDPLRILAQSTGLAAIFGGEPEALWSRPEDVVPSSVRLSIEAALAEPSDVVTDLIDLGGRPAVEDGRRTWDVIGHVSDGVAIVEFEQGDWLGIDQHALANLERRLQAVVDRDEFFAQVPVLVQQLLGYDRVMIYRFDVDGHGSVVGEAKREHLEPFLGLHYPATDIPPMARQLFLVGGTRSIPDVHQADRPLDFRPDRSPGQHLDLGRSQLRATSPVHVKYLQNMGVGATLTIPIVIGGELWGLLACHHYRPRNPDRAARAAADLVGGMVAQRLLEFELADAAEMERRSMLAEENFLEAIRIEDQHRLRFLREPAVLTRLCPCDGAAVVADGRAVLTVGVTPDEDQLSRLTERLGELGGDVVHQTDSIGRSFPGLLGDSESIGGFLAVQVSQVNQSFLVWFRRPERQSVQWAGNPDEAGLSEQLDDDGEVQLGPRASFARWSQVIEDRCAPWPRWAEPMAHRIRQRVLRLELEHASKVVERSNHEFYQLTYAAAHDLREPLRTQLNFLEILDEQLDEAGPEVARTVDRINAAAVRMQDLVDDLLHYADITQEPEREVVDLDVVAREVISDLATPIADAGAQVTIDPLPPLIGDVRYFRQLLQNLLSNAIKYVEPGVAPEVQVSSARNQDTVTLEVADNGIGIAPEYHDRIFSLFSRLHRKDQYFGTGIGLAIVKRIVEQLDGELGVESELGKGSTFWVRFHHASPGEPTTAGIVTSASEST